MNTIMDNKLIIGISLTAIALTGIGYGIYKYFSSNDKKEATKEEEKKEENN